MARKFFIKNEKTLSIGEILEIDGEEFNHIANVLRKKVGDSLCLIDGTGLDYFCTIEKICKKSAVVKIKKIEKTTAETSSEVTVFMALTKGEKMGFICQKLTELGVREIVPFASKFCQVKKNNVNVEKLQKISNEALKQCGRSLSVKIENALGFEEMLTKLGEYECVLFAYENCFDNVDIKKELTSKKKVAIIVGSEGGFSFEESERIVSRNNVLSVSLGNRILRAETAAIGLSSVVMFLLGEWERK